MNKFIIAPIAIVALLIFLLAKTATVESISTPHIISIVQPATVYGNEMIIASCDNGTLLCYNYRGDKRWETTLSGSANHTICCVDMNSNGCDEIIAANHDGSIYCLNHDGGIEWVYSQQQMPLKSLCTVKIEGHPYIVCCGDDSELHYLSASGSELGSISVLEENKLVTEQGLVSLLKNIKLPDGNEVIALLGKSAEQDKPIANYLHLFHPLAKLPYKSITLPNSLAVASASVSYNNALHPTLLLGSDMGDENLSITKVDIVSGEVTTLQMPFAIENETPLTYNNLKCETIGKASSEELLVLLNSNIVLASNSETIQNQQHYKDLYYSLQNNKVVLTSTSACGDVNYIDIVNVGSKKWKERLANHQYGK